MINKKNQNVVYYKCLLRALRVSLNWLSISFDLAAIMLNALVSCMNQTEQNKNAEKPFDVIVGGEHI